MRRTVGSVPSDLRDKFRIISGVVVRKPHAWLAGFKADSFRWQVSERREILEGVALVVQFLAPEAFLLLPRSLRNGPKMEHALRLSRDLSRPPGDLMLALHGPASQRDIKQTGKTMWSETPNACCLATVSRRHLATEPIDLSRRAVTNRRNHLDGHMQTHRC
jgi:hypothetical protein